MGFDMKKFIFEFFLEVNRQRHISLLIGSFLLFFSFMQISSLAQFRVHSDQIDEFENSIKVISVLINYPLYFGNESKLSIENVKKIEIIIYIYTAILICLCIICALELKKKKKFKIAFILLRYFFIYAQFLVYIPFILLLQRHIFVHSTIVSIVHFLLIMFYILLCGLLFYLNILSSIASKDFFNANSNILFVDFFILQILSFALFIVVYYSQTFLPFAYIILFGFSIKILYNILFAFLFYGENILTCYFAFFVLFLERLIISIANKYSNQLYKTYFISTIIVTVISFLFAKKILYKLIENFGLTIEKRPKGYKQSLMLISSLINALDNEMLKSAFIAKHIEFCVKKNCAIDAKASIEFAKSEYLNMIKEVFFDLLQQYRLDFNFRLSYVLFILFHFANFELALTEMEAIKNEIALSFAEKFVLYLLKSTANERIIQRCESANEKWSIFAINDVINYDKVTCMIKAEVYNAIEKKRDLWTAMESEDIIVEELCEKGALLFSVKSRLSSLWHDIIAITNNNIDTEIKRIYCDYLVKICDDKIESAYIMENDNIASKMRSNDEVYDNRFKSSTGLMILSANRSINPGKITYVNAGLLRSLGYSFKSELVGNNVKFVIPGDIGRFHDDIIRNYFDKGKSDFLRKTHSHLCIKTKEKFILPIDLNIAVLPSLMDSMKGVAMIHVKEKADEVIITNEYGLIEATTKLIANLLNIAPNLIEKNSYYIQTFFIDLMRPDTNGVPLLFRDKTTNKKREYKVEISCPKVNTIDTSKYKLKTRNVFLLRSNVRKGHDAKRESTTYAELIMHLKTATHQEISMSPRRNKNRRDSSGASLANYFKNINFYKPHQVLKKNIFEKKQEKSPDISTIHTFRKIISSSLSKVTQTRKMYDMILQSMTISHELHTLTEKCEVNLSAINMEILNSRIKLSFFYIPFENIFANKRKESFESLVSEKELLAKVIKPQSSENKENVLYEIGSVAGKDMNITLQKHLKHLKTRKYKSYTNFKFAYFSISLFVIIATILIIIFGIRICNKSKKYFDTIYYTHNLNICLLDLGKYSQLIFASNLSSLTSIEIISSFHSKLKRNAQNILSIVGNITQSISFAFGVNLVTSHFKAITVSLSLTNKKIDVSFLNALYFIIENSLKSAKSSLLNIRGNITSVLKVIFATMINSFEVEYNKGINLYFFFQIFFANVVIISTVVFLVVLFANYKNKKNEQISILLSAYEQLRGEDIEKVIMRIDNFENKYISIFKNIDEYNKKKIKFSQKNSKFINRRNREMLLKMQKEEKIKNSYNILNAKKNDNDIIEKPKKKLIIRDNISMRYFTSFFFTFAYIIIYFVFYIYSSYEMRNISFTAKKIAHLIFASKFLMSYEVYSLDSSLFLNFYYIDAENENSSSFDVFINTTMQNYQNFLYTININHNLFKQNISQILNDNICDVITMDICSQTELNFTLSKGMRSIIGIYISNIKEAYSFYQNNYEVITDISKIYLNDKFVLARNLAENLYIVYDEIFYQLNDSFNSVMSIWSISQIIVGIVISVLFLLGVFYKLNSFIEQIKQEEMLCNKLITEIPSDIILDNPDLKASLANSLDSSNMQKKKK